MQVAGHVKEYVPILVYKEIAGMEEQVAGQIAASVVALRTIPLGWVMIAVLAYHNRCCPVLPVLMV